jgi:hypothetical protein
MFVANTRHGSSKSALDCGSFEKCPKRGKNSTESGNRVVLPKNSPSSAQSPDFHDNRAGVGTTLPGVFLSGRQPTSASRKDLAVFFQRSVEPRSLPNTAGSRSLRCSGRLMRSSAMSRSVSRYSARDPRFPVAASLAVLALLILPCERVRDASFVSGRGQGPAAALYPNPAWSGALFALPPPAPGLFSFVGASIQIVGLKQKY